MAEDEELFELPSGRKVKKKGDKLHCHYCGEYTVSISSLSCLM